MKYSVVLLALLTTSAAAQERVFTLVLPESQLNYIGKIVAKQPYEDAAAVIDTIKAQVQQQQAKAADDADKPRRDAQAEIDRLKGEIAKQQSGGDQK